MRFISNLPLTIERLGLSVSSELDGNPPLWVTRKPGPAGEEEVFINNAKVLKQPSNFQSKIKVNGDIKTQVLHVIDEVLEPVRSMSSESPIYNPDAFQFLNQSENLNMGNHRVRINRSRYFPVYVKSNTIVGDASHQPGVVLAEIVKPNIPVRNGVIHLIQRPLMVIDSTVKDFLEEKEDGPVYKFYETIRDFGDDIMMTISRLHDVTLFAPSNAALEEPGVRQILQDKRRVKEILNLHYVKQRLPLEKIQNKSVIQIPTAADRKKLYFNVVQGPAGNQTITVEGGGVNATVVTANIAATNGIIHIIDRVLGVPYTTVLEKLQTDPMLNSTYFLGQRRGFNDQLNDTTKRFTYFAPRDYAWSSANISYPSAIKKLFMPDFSYHTKQILERHLVVADQVYTMAKLKEMNYNDTITLTSARDTLKLRIKESGESYQIEWDGKWIRVFRHDVECTNGIIHVIDGVFLKDSDVRVTGGASLASIAPHLIIFLIVKWLL
ncbi:hypothetical protein M0804_012807 [Polistes exclamans]|nr:hypothetical protein M0804_012807 [Polistes exclamans]